MPPLDDKQQKALDVLMADAVGTKNLARVQMCLQKGAALDATVRPQGLYGTEGPRPLAHYAYEKYDKAVFETLAKAGLPMEAKDSDGNTVLSRAVGDSNAACVEHFLKCGANPLSVNNGGTTILDRARTGVSASGSSPAREKIIDLLLAAMPEAGADFAAASPPAPSAVETKEDVVVRKPVALAPHSQKKDGFTL